MIIGIDEKPKKWYQWLFYSFQHVLAMFVANSLIALILFANYGVNLVPAALISAGLGTIAYILITKFRSPVFLGSSAALLAVMMPCLAMGAFDSSGNLIGGNYIALAIGLGVVGLVYIIVGTIIRFTGVDWLNKLLPPVIVGSVIILIGLGLATFATSWSMYNASSGAYNGWSLFVALATMLTICIVSHYAKGFFKTIPFLCGILAGYVLALILTFIGLSNGNKHMQLIDFSIFNNIRWVPDFAFLHFENSLKVFSWSQLPTIILIAVPIAFVAICEHIGDHLNLSNITGRYLLEDPGLGRTLTGDGLATIIGGIFGGMGNTTYGENVAVIGVTKIASSRVIFSSAILAILLGFCPHLMLAVQSIPYCVFGGAALILYGFISISGVKALQKVDLNNNKNLLVTSVILVSGIGGLVLNFTFGSITFTFTSTALAMILGILLNNILRDVKQK